MPFFFLSFFLYTKGYRRERRVDRSKSLLNVNAPGTFKSAQTMNGNPLGRTEGCVYCDFFGVSRSPYKFSKERRKEKIPSLFIASIRRRRRRFKTRGVLLISIAEGEPRAITDAESHPPPFLATAVSVKTTLDLLQDARAQSPFKPFVIFTHTVPSSSSSSSSSFLAIGYARIFMTCLFKNG